jgi:SagB-type dehydrogenase family enzyme
MPLIPDPDPFQDILQKPADAGLELFQAQRLFESSFDLETESVFRYLKDPARVRQSRKHFKTYPSKPQYSLQPNPKLLRKNLHQILQDRETQRDFDGRAEISAGVVASLLHFAAGLKEVPARPGQKRGPTAPGQTPRRNYPSPGGLYSHEIYVALLRSDLGPAGLYHYNVQAGSLELLQMQDPREILSKLCRHENPEKILAASCVIFMTCIFDRALQKYSRRGWKFLQFETGVLMQNFYVVAESLGLGVWPMGNIVEDHLLDYLGIDGIHEGFMTSLWIGKPTQEPKKSLWTRLTSVFGKSLRRDNFSIRG